MKNKNHWVFIFTYVNNKWGGTKLEYVTNKGKKEAYRIAENNMSFDAAEDLKLLSRKKYIGDPEKIKAPVTRSYIDLS